MTFVFSSCSDENSESSVNDISVSETETTTETLPEEVTEDVTESGTIDEISTAEPETRAYLENADKTPFVGKWECSKLIANGTELTELSGLPIYAVFQYGILEDGTIELPESLMEVADTENPVTYTWGVVSDNEIEISGSNGSSVTYTLENGHLANISKREEIYLDKVDEFTYFDFKGYYEELMSQQGGYVLTPVQTDADGNIIDNTETVTAE